MATRLRAAIIFRATDTEYRCSLLDGHQHGSWGTLRHTLQYFITYSTVYRVGGGRNGLVRLG